MSAFLIFKTKAQPNRPIQENGSQRPSIKSKLYKAGDFRAKATLKGGTVTVTVKLGRYELDISPISVPVSEWTERRSENPVYDRMEYLNRRYNTDGDSQTSLVLDAVRWAIDEVVEADAKHFSL